MDEVIEFKTRGVFSLGDFRRSMENLRAYRDAYFANQLKTRRQVAGFMWKCRRRILKRFGIRRSKRS
jgi:hypothetical protein